MVQELEHKNTSSFSQFLSSMHHKLVFLRRLEALCKVIAPLISPGRVLDVGAGNGMIGAQLMNMRNDINVEGIDVHLRLESAIKVLHYDGVHIPFESNTFSSVILIDVLHHIDDYRPILSECMRVSRGNVVIKDHFCENQIEYGILKLLDWVGNRPHGVRLPYIYFSRSEWLESLRSVQAVEKNRQEIIPGMYLQPFQILIGQGIQFVSQLVPVD